jgi:hypothetical protein
MVAEIRQFVYWSGSLHGIDQSDQRPEVLMMIGFELMTC